MAQLKSGPLARSSAGRAGPPPGHATPRSTTWRTGDLPLLDVGTGDNQSMTEALPALASWDSTRGCHRAPGSGAADELAGSPVGLVPPLTPLAVQHRRRIFDGQQLHLDGGRGAGRAGGGRTGSVVGSTSIRPRSGPILPIGHSSRVVLVCVSACSDTPLVGGGFLRFRCHRG